MSNYFIPDAMSSGIHGPKMQKSMWSNLSVKTPNSNCTDKNCA